MTPERQRLDRDVPDRPVGRPGRSGSAAVPPTTAPGAHGSAAPGPAPGRLADGVARRRGNDDTTATHWSGPAHLAGRSRRDDDGDPTVSSMLSLGASAATAAAVAPVQEPDEAAPKDRHLKVVAPKPRPAADRRRRTRLLLGVAAVGAAFVVFSLVYLHVISTEKQFTIDRLANQEAQQEQRYEDLRLAANQAAAPSSIYRKAIRDGMQEPTDVQAVQAPRGSASTGSSSLTPANGATAPSGASDWPAVESQTGGGS